MHQAISIEELALRSTADLIALHTALAHYLTGLPEGSAKHDNALVTYHNIRRIVEKRRRCRCP